MSVFSSQLKRSQILNGEGLPYAVVSPQNPYIEQQFPAAQAPQTVPPLELPHEPSVVVGADAAIVVVLTGAMTGSWEEVVVTDAVFTVQPFWQPLETKQ